ncbi:MAG TPA: DUF6510 family protein [Acidimicrobiales bacterium]|jgi:hypothetical protein|nr:DUF6510 family protein [Acidimicrobiales bacterium]
MASDRALDGNAVGGLLGEVFVHEITAAASRCDGCGAIEQLGASRAYLDAPGTVLRCLHCEGVLLRLVHDGDRWWIDLRGLRWLQFGPSPDDPA